jgi:ATP-dependent Clp protease ATP-binding subunit ClpA
MVFFTSNLGYSDAMQRAAPIGYGDSGDRAEAAGREVAQDLRRALRPEFVNRVRMIHFRSLGRDSAERILTLEFDRIARRYRDVHGVELRLAASAREAFLERGFSPKFGARHMAAMLEQVCNVEIARRIRRDDRREESDREQVVAWLRRVRSSGKPIDLDEVRQRVVATTRARLDYDTLEIALEDGAFAYRPVRTGNEP